ncbi:MAG: VWA domain-containing protein [Myxococcota bacterium]
MSDRFSRLTRHLRPHLSALGRGLGRQLAPAARLARLDTSVLRAWLGRVSAVRDALGPAESMGYTRLIVAVTERDPDIARIIAYTLPDHLARVARDERPRYLSLLRAVMNERITALPLVIRTLPDLLERLDDENLASYLTRGMALHRQSSRKAESFFKMESDESHRVADEMRRGTALSSVRRVLTLYARAHCGETVQIRPGGARAFTDGRHIYLPESMDHFGDERDFLIYRVLTARNAGYLEFGTLDLEVDALDGEWPAPRPDELETERLLRGFGNTAIARDLFTIFENARVESRVRDEYPGIRRDMDALDQLWRPPRPTSETLAPVERVIEWLYQTATRSAPTALDDPDQQQAAQSAASILSMVTGPGATVLDSARALQRAYPILDAMLRKVQDDERNPIDPDQDGSAGGGSEGSGDRSSDADARAPSMEPRGAGHSGEDDDDLPGYQPLRDDPLSGSLQTGEMSDADRQSEQQIRDLLAAMRESQPEASPQQARARARESGTTYEEMAAFLDRMQAPAGPQTEETAAPDPPTPGERSRTVQRSLDEGDGTPGKTFLYPEWDADIEDHKPRWIRLTEHTLPAGDPAFVQRVREEYGPLVRRLRQAFEALRPEAIRRVRGVMDGEEIDIDRAIAARLERRSGGSPSERIYTRRLRQERDVAVAFLLDMSSSTNEVANADGKRVLDVEKEALVLIAEAVDAIGDACAIYGFSGYGRDSVAFYVAKDFTDRWDSRVAERVGRISWKMENRDGAAIRHATSKLAAWPARVKLLLLLSDGKPLDCGCDHYADFYAQEDTRMALREARTQGIHPFCITVDPHGQEYLSRMYGEYGYTVIDRVEALPTRLPRIYRRLTR